MDFVFNIGDLTATQYSIFGPQLQVKCKDFLSLQKLFLSVKEEYGNRGTHMQWVIPLLNYNPEDKMETELDVIEELIDDDPFLRSYPTFEKYYSDWIEMGGIEASHVPQHLVFDFYAEKQTPEQALHTWFTYDAPGVTNPHSSFTT